MQRTYLTRSNPNFSMDLGSSWAAKPSHGYSDVDLTSILTRARFQQKQLAEKEEKLSQLYERQQQRTLDRVVKSRTGNIQYRSTADGRVSGETSPGAASSTSTSSTSSQKMMGNGRVRQMFEERRQVTKTGIDKSYPLAPMHGTKLATKAKSATKSFDQTFTLDNDISTSTYSTTSIYSSKTNNNEIVDKFSNLTMFDGDDRVNNNEFDGGLLDDETFPEVELIDDDLDVSFGKLPNVVRSLPSERVKQEVKPLSVAKNGATIGVRNGVTNGERNGVRNGVAATNGVRNGVGTRFPASKSTIGLVKRPSRLGDGDSQSTRSLVQKPDIKKTAPIVRNPPPPVRKAPTPAEKLRKSPSPIQSPSPTTMQRTAMKHTPHTLLKAPTSRPSPPRKQSSPIKQATPRQDLGAVTNDNLVSCQYCNRRFAKDRLEKHQEICAKTSHKKRKPYDALKHRVVGTEAEAYVKKGTKQQPVQAAAPKKQDWRRKHEEFIEAIRAAKKVQDHLAKGGDIRDLPPPPPSSNPDYVQCPHCGRKFNQSAADRHIPKCADYSFNKPGPGAKRVMKR